MEQHNNHQKQLLLVDVIIPIYNAESTLRESVLSALHQVVPSHLQSFFSTFIWDVAVCCFDDGSTDQSWAILSAIDQELLLSEPTNTETRFTTTERITCQLLMARGTGGSRGAGYARNQAVALRSNMADTLQPSAATKPTFHFLCLLDSDDTMHCTRIAEQVHYMLSLPAEERERTLLGCTFDRYPAGSTWHYSNWANGLSDERLYLERFREVTLIQPTWLICRSRFTDLGGYLEAPNATSVDSNSTASIFMDGSSSTTGEQKSIDNANAASKNHQLRLIHPTFDSLHTLRLAEDLRFFHAHLYDGGLLKLLRTKNPLLTYRHRAGVSQSSSTSRILLLQLRVLAFEICILNNDPCWSGPFVVWGAGRDGKNFIKSLSDSARKRVMCLVDVDVKKIEPGYYINGDMIRIPIVHFAWLARDSQVRCFIDDEFGRIQKKKPVDCQQKQLTSGCPASDELVTSRPNKKPRRSDSRCTTLPTELDESLLHNLPVVVCVAMYRTAGALEKNVQSIGRTEGKDLWHFN